MKEVKIAVFKTMLNEDLTNNYGIPRLRTCPMMKVGDVSMLTSHNQRTPVMKRGR